jgi:hypothetical protein
MTLLEAILSLLQWRTRQPSLPRMSDEWLHNFDRSPDREFEWWR